MKQKIYLYRPAECETDAELIEQLFKTLQNYTASTEHYLKYFGAPNKQTMQYWNDKAQSILQKMKQPPYTPKTP